jgi:hypothetical protein
MIEKFGEHRVVQDRRKAELEKEGKPHEELNEQLQVSFEYFNKDLIDNNS